MIFNHITNFIYKDTGPFAQQERAEKHIIIRIISTFWHRDTQKVLLEAGKLTILLMFIISNALILKHVLTEQRIPHLITEVMLEMGLGPITFLVVVN